MLQEKPPLLPAINENPPGCDINVAMLFAFTPPPPPSTFSYLIVLSLSISLTINYSNASYYE